MNKKNNHLFFYMTYVMFSQNFYGTTKFLENVFPFRFNWQRNTIEEDFSLCLYDIKLNDFRWLIIAKKNDDDKNENENKTIFCNIQINK